MGNSKAVAAKYYLQVTDAHFLKATQNPTQSVSASGCQQETAEKKNPNLEVPVIPWHMCSNIQVAEEGLEPPTRGL